MKKPKKYPNEVKLPEGFEIPATEDGKTFEAVVEIRKDDGRYCVVAIDGIPMDDEEDETDEEEDLDEPLGSRAKSAMSAPYA